MLNTLDDLEFGTGLLARGKDGGIYGIDAANNLVRLGSSTGSTWQDFSGVANNIISLNQAKAGFYEFAASAPKTTGDVFTHGFKYDPRIRARGVADGVGHNFPYSLDDSILSVKPTTLPSGASGYAMRGTHNGKEVVYNIVVNNGVIVHRDFVSAANWAQRSKSFGFNIDYANLPK